jgi:hypothetical protein
MDGCDALTARIEATCQRIMAQFDRIEAQTTAIFDHLDGRRRLPGAPMSVERNAYIEALRELRREAERREAQRREGLLQDEMEKLLPADVPLHKRGFGVMEDE